MEQKIIGESSSEWTPTTGLVVSGEVNVFKSPTYINLQFVPGKSKATRNTGLTTADGRQVLLDVGVDGHVVGIEIV